MNLPGKRLLLGTAVAAAAFGVGGFAYAAGDDPAPDQGYVTVEEGPSAGTPSTDPGTGPAQGSSALSDGRDCPEKNGSGQAQPEGQPEQTQPEGQADPQSNA